MALFGRKKQTQADGTTPLERLAGQGPDSRAAGVADDPRSGPSRADATRRDDAEYRRQRDHGERTGVAETSRGDDVAHQSRTSHEHDARPTGRAAQKEQFGGLSIGSAFFGYLVSVGISVLLVAILGAAGTAVGIATVGDQAAAEQQAGTIGIVGAVLLLIALAIAYYAGGYVAGRLARFSGAKQGLAVWIISILVTAIAGVVGYVAGSQYNVFSSLQLPSVPISGSTLGTSGLVALIVVIVVTLLAAILGGRLGQRWHTKVDRVGR